jgi:hypothetical protein
MLRLLVEAGGDINIQGEGGTTPLHMAAQYGRSVIAHLPSSHLCSIKLAVNCLEKEFLQAAPVGWIKLLNVRLTARVRASIDGFCRCTGALSIVRMLSGIL